MISWPWHFLWNRSSSMKSASCCESHNFPWISVDIVSYISINISHLLHVRLQHVAADRLTYFLQTLNLCITDDKCCIVEVEIILLVYICKTLKYGQWNLCDFSNSLMVIIPLKVSSCNVVGVMIGSLKSNQQVLVLTRLQKRYQHLSTAFDLFCKQTDRHTVHWSNAISRFWHPFSVSPSLSVLSCQVECNVAIIIC